MGNLTHANLLSFIQVAVVFDFGLLYLKDTHIFNDIFASFCNEHKERVASMLRECKDIIAQLEQRTPNINVRIQKQIITQNKNRLEALVNSKNIPWSKYAYLGLYSGVYGLICLFIIGLFGWKCEETLNSFLLIITIEIGILEGLALYQMFKIESSKVSMNSILNKSLFLIGVIFISFGLIFTNLISIKLPNFETCFLISIAGITYFPFLVFILRVVYAKIQIISVKKKCNKALSKAKEILKKK